MAKQKKDLLKYLTINELDEKWGIVVTTAGYQFIPPQTPYPLSVHPEHYAFKPQTGRILNEYQLVYITKGDGYFSSQSCPKKRIKAGTMILLFPGEWHSYHPDIDTGWDEYWVGFRGPHIDKRVENGFFSCKEPLHHIGISSGIVSLYEEILRIAAEEKFGYQQMASSIVLHILGSMYYKEKNNSFTDRYVIDKINEARILMRDFENMKTAEEIAREIGVGYSWFRRFFKEYTGFAPSQYVHELRLQHAKSLLTNTTLNAKEIAFDCGFKSPEYFFHAFKCKTGLTPLEYRKQTSQPT